MSFAWLAGADLVWGSVAVTALYLAVLVFSLTRSEETIYSGAPDRRRWRDLRLWILPLVALQIGLYWLFR